MAERGVTECSHPFWEGNSGQNVDRGSHGQSGRCCDQPGLGTAVLRACRREAGSDLRWASLCHQQDLVTSWPLEGEAAVDVEAPRAPAQAPGAGGAGRVGSGEEGLSQAWTCAV